MVGEINKRPAPDVLRSRLAEVAKRYRKRKKRRSTTAPQLASIRVSEFNRLARSRHGAQLPNDPEARRLIEVVAHHLAHLSGHLQSRLHGWISERAPWLTTAETNAILTQVVTAPRTWKADTLAWHLAVTYAERTALNLTTIGARDYTKIDRAIRRRTRSKVRSKAYRSAKRCAANTP